MREWKKWGGYRILSVVLRLKEYTLPLDPAAELVPGSADLAVDPATRAFDPARPVFDPLTW